MFTERRDVMFTERRDMMSTERRRVHGSLLDEGAEAMVEEAARAKSPARP